MLDIRELMNLKEAYAEVYAPQELTEEQVWEEVETWVNSLIEEGYDLSDYTWEEMYDAYANLNEARTDPRGRPASGPMNVYANSKGKPSQAHLDAVKSYDAEQKKKTPEQRKKELDDYRERQMNNK